MTFFNPLSPNPTKWSNTLKQFMFDHFVGLALKGLIVMVFSHFFYLILVLYHRNDHFHFLIFFFSKKISLLTINYSLILSMLIHFHCMISQQQGNPLFLGCCFYIETLLTNAEIIDFIHFNPVLHFI